MRYYFLLQQNISEMDSPIGLCFTLIIQTYFFDRLSYILLPLHISKVTFFYFFYFSAVDCPVLTSPDRGSVQVQRDEDGRLSTAKFSCQAGHILWGAEQLVCDDGSWSSSVPLCKILNCGAPPYMPHATASLINGRTVWGDEATYYCNDGYIMIANVTSGGKTLFYTFCVLQANLLKGTSL